MLKIKLNTKKRPVAAVLFNVITVSLLTLLHWPLSRPFNVYSVVLHFFCVVSSVYIALRFEHIALSLFQQTVLTKKRLQLDSRL